MATHQSALTPISDFFPSSKVATMQQTDIAAHKLKPRSFHKSACYESWPLELDNEVTLYRIYTRELDGELCIG